MLRKAWWSAFVLTAAVSTSACFLRFTLGATFVESLSDEIDAIITAIDTNATTAVCQTDPFFSPDFHRCTYIVNGEIIASTTHLLNEGGVFGALVDPVVLQLPSNVTDVAGTFSGGGTTGNLVVYPNLSYLPIDNTRTLAAPPGTQLVVVDLPDGVPVAGVDYSFNFSFRQLAPAGSGPTPFKALLTGKVRAFGKTYYPPMLPCVDSFDSLPEIRVPIAGQLQSLTLPSSGLSGCVNERYVYFRVGQACDLDNDFDIDSTDVGLIMNVRNRTAAAGDPRDVNADGVINANDARFCTARCTRARCS